MALVEVVARANRRMLRAQCFRQIRIALEADLEWEAIEIRESEHLARTLEHGHLLAEWEVFDYTRFAEAASTKFIWSHTTAGSLGSDANERMRNG